MDLFESIILGLIQGILEWVPVSSEGISSLVMVNFFGKSIQDAIYLSIWLHIGTLLAALLYFRKEIRNILVNLPDYLKKQKSETSTITSFLIVATLCSVGIGGIIFFYGLEKISLTGAGATLAIGVLLIFTGILQKTAQKTALIKKTQLKDSIYSGLAQGFAILPGISRSGITSSVLLLRKYSADQALRLSFLMSIPAVMAATAALLLKQTIVINAGSITALVVAAVSGFLTIKYFLKLAQKIDFSYFCFILGALSLLAAFL